MFSPDDGVYQPLEEPLCNFCRVSLHKQIVTKSEGCLADPVVATLNCGDFNHYLERVIHHISLSLSVCVVCGCVVCGSYSTMRMTVFPTVCDNTD